MVDRKHDGPRARRHVIAIVAVLIVGAIVGEGVWSRAHARAGLETWTQQQAIATVNVVQPAFTQGAQQLVLPGRLAANYDAPIYARVSGYLKTWDVDIGTHVHKGQVLAEIETPDLNAQLSQAQADLANANAAAQLAQSTAKRWQQMLDTDSVSQQAVDEKTSDAQVKQAAVEAARANVQRLAALEAYKTITAPFDGIVTERHTDIGDLINAGGGQGPELFRVADERQLRVYVDVPQNDAAAIGSKLQATLTVPERPGKVFDAQYVSSASAVNTATGAVTIELLCDNAKGQLIPGAYTQVHLTLDGGGARALQIPSSALMLGDHGVRVATIGADGRVVMKPVTISRDLGQVVEIGAGIGPQDRVVDNPPDSLEQGDPVRIARAAHAGAADAQG
ncbi:efflux RND transporter periplasmic adaptor subunit [Pararobbsia silviterrae]|uniref:Efflux RND transporter periplasmic adaptor subunit n=1 Tax=Pararobbsia silviterrae TaxID=1792498 RepID=A0A494XSU2_9BURK|nr:efflux RND transporter periplasmic adaptor subunit [Pararobbsia silviterrae]RKP51946.1 efflux RND transporter periplasmic adaptor subunit [Pararobbsia silviterrae]